MHFNKLIQLLAPFHAAQLIAAYVTENGIQAQITTGNPDFPFIAVNDSMVTKEDVFFILDLYDNQIEEPQESFSFASNIFSTPESCWGLQTV